MITIEFRSEWDRYKAGDIVRIETTLGRRLIGLGIATSPNPAIIPDPPAEEAQEDQKKKAKAASRGRYKKVEKAVKIDE